MNKRLFRIIGGTLCLLVLTFIGIIIYDNDLHQQEDLGLNRPDIGSYRNTGYFKIDPKTILISLENGEIDVFTPLPEDEALHLERRTDLALHWTQADFLKIAGVLGQLVWNDPMDLKDWSVYNLAFFGIYDGSADLRSASITYFRTGGDGYETRRIEIRPYYNWVRWGSERTYPQPILRKWKRADLAGANISGDEAFRRVNEEVKAYYQLQDGSCELMIYISRFDPERWHIGIWYDASESVFYTVNLDTGDILEETK